jgi:hypothetical protein
MAQANPLPDLNNLNQNDPQFVAAALEYQRQLAEAHQTLAEQHQRLQQLQLQGAPQLANTLDKLGDKIATQTITEGVETYSGKPSELNRWFKSVEKHCLLTYGRLEANECKLIAYRCSKTAVSDFLKGFLERNPGVSWDETKTELRRRFGEILDPQTKILRTRKYKQNTNQSVQVFSEVLQTRGTEIFEHEMDTSFVQHELVCIFCQGLRSRYVARRIIEHNPPSLAEATALAIRYTEQKVRVDAHGLGEPEPMEVNELRKGHGKNSKGKGRKDGKKDDKTQTKDKFKWKNGKPICQKCGEVGHIRRECKNPKQAPKEPEHEENDPEKELNKGGHDLLRFKMPPITEKLYFILQIVITRLLVELALEIVVISTERCLTLGVKYRYCQNMFLYGPLVKGPACYPLPLP